MFSQENTLRSREKVVRANLSYRGRLPGVLIALMVAIYAIGRFLLEIIRTDETGFLGTGLTVSQNISLALLVAAIALWFYILRQPPRKVFEEGA